VSFTRERASSGAACVAVTRPLEQVDASMIQIGAAACRPAGAFTSAGPDHAIAGGGRAGLSLPRQLDHQ
jgi:hypothetical protein